MTRFLLFMLILLSLGTLFPGALWADSAPLSNVLPKALVEELIGTGKWDQTFDLAAAPEARDLKEFWLGLQSENTGIEKVVDQLFATHSGGDPATVIQLPRLYPVKVIMLRYARRNAATARVRWISDSWARRYLEMALATVDLSATPDLMAIARAFRQKVERGEIRITDLSPVERERIQTKIPQSHGVNILAKDEDTGAYRITGLYNGELHYFALDFARPIEETLITFVHEMIHAADPKLDAYRRDYSSLTDPALRALRRWLKGAPNEEFLAMDLVGHIFFEMGLDAFDEVARMIRERRMRQLESELSRDPGDAVFSPVEPTEDELKSVHQWIRTVIGLTVENEYRAYGFSTALYGVLKGRFHMLPASPERQKFLERFLSGDSVIATQLSVAMNPFRGARSEIFKRFLKPELRDRPDAGQKMLFLRVGQVLDRLELIYLKETEHFMKELGNRIASILRGITAGSLRETGTLPDWALPGGFELPSNPFNVLTARITTAWVLRFRRNLDLFLADLKSMNEPLMTARAGVLDLHDITRGERKLIGISFDNSPWTGEPAELNGNLKSDLDKIPLDITRLFELVQWTPDSAIRGDVIDGKEAAANLTKLRTVKAAIWLDQAFPPLKETFLGVKSFLQRLREGLFNADELPAERVKELQAELVAAWGAGSIGKDELLHLKILLAELGRLHEIASESKWAGITESFQSKARFVLQSIELLGVDGNKTAETIASEDRAAYDAFALQMRPYREKCEKLTDGAPYRLGGFWPERGPFRLGEASFPLALVCYAGKIHAVRQPGDYLTIMTTLIRTNGPEARIFSGARPVRLAPLEIPGEEARRKTEEQKSCFLFHCF